MNILETKDLYHDFSGLKVLFDVNLQVIEGERHAIIGPNGAGGRFQRATWPLRHWPQLDF